jgi:hypothetical protein
MSIALSHRFTVEDYLGYSQQRIVTEGDLAPAAFPDAKIDVTELLH